MHLDLPQTLASHSIPIPISIQTMGIPRGRLQHRLGLFPTAEVAAVAITADTGREGSSLIRIGWWRWGSRCSWGCNSPAMVPRYDKMLIRPNTSQTLKPSWLW